MTGIVISEVAAENERTLNSRRSTSGGRRVRRAVEREGGEQDQAGGERRDHDGVAEASPDADLGGREQDRGQGGREQDQAGDVEVGALALDAGLQAAPGQEQAGQGERHVDPEDPPPREVADDQPTGDRPQDRPSVGRLIRAMIRPSLRPPAASTSRFCKMGSMRPPPMP